MFLSIILLLASAFLFFIAFSMSDDNLLVGTCAVVVGLFGFFHTVDSKTIHYHEPASSFTVEVTNYHLYVYKKGEMHKGAIYQSDKAFDVAHANDFDGINYDRTYNLFGIEMSGATNPKLTFKEAK